MGPVTVIVDNDGKRTKPHAAAVDPAATSLDTAKASSGSFVSISRFFVLSAQSLK